mmetsp:Transcript_1508/g.4537  ORF Transcript_1508/g.4537 Transcript_1508/m.4537 type:complete len:258 (+) Transcript_1508:91-864(+)
MGTSRLGGLLDQRDEDWRDTLFYWHGKVSWVGGERKQMSWRGTWLSSVAQIQPTAAEFGSSFNHFELNFELPEGSGREVLQGRWELGVFCGVGGELRGHYLMEPPDGAGYRRAYRDDKHELRFDRGLEHHPHLGPFVLCAARGVNEFGRFVALGHARRARGTGSLDDAVELTLARRYVRDDDSRWHWHLDQLLASVPPNPLHATRAAPWEHALPCRLPCDVIAEANHHAQFLATFQPPKPPPKNEYEAMMQRKRPRS